MSTRGRDHVDALFARGNLIKICGLRDPEHAVAAAEAGADLLGFIFAPSRRLVDAATARACIEAARAVKRATPVLAVGVFVDAELSDLARTADASGLDLFQLSGRESVAYLEALPLPAIKAFQPGPAADAATVLDGMRPYFVPGKGAAAALVDGYHPSAKGGTGIRADWQLAAAVSACRPFLLAGGLDSECVGEAISTVCPLGVDVSGGVESDGVKDSRLIAEFVLRAREAFDSANLDKR